MTLASSPPPVFRSRWRPSKILALACFMATTLCACGAGTTGSIGPASSSQVSGQATPAPGSSGVPGTSPSTVPTSSQPATAASPVATDLPETALSGEVPLVDQLDGRAKLGYHRGLKLIGQTTIGNRGSNFAMAWVGTCAYVGTTSALQLYGANQNPYITPSQNALNGVEVIDVSNPQSPQPVGLLRSLAMLDPHESLQGNDVRKILVATSSAGNALDVYDASDCLHPVLKSETLIGPGINDVVTQGIEFKGHAMCLSPDGTMAYATGTPYNNAAVDLTDLAHPVVKQLYVQAAHDCDVSPDGTRLYEAVFGGAVYGSEGLLLSPAGQVLDSADNDLPPYGTSDFNGLLILDSTQFQQHLASPKFSVVGTLQWTPEGEMENAAAGSHTARYFTQNGHPYLYSSDEWPIVPACPWAHGRILDIGNESTPSKIVDITLGVQLQANCASTQIDVANYSAHYAGFDNNVNPKLLFTSEYAGGLRVYDISNPYAPAEIAYYHPIPIPNEPLSAGSQLSFGTDMVYDPVPPYIHYDRATGNIWATGISSGFSVYHLTTTAGPIPSVQRKPGVLALPASGMPRTYR